MIICFAVHQTHLVVNIEIPINSTHILYFQQSLTSLQSQISYEFGFLSNLTHLVELQIGDATCLPPEVGIHVHYYCQINLSNSNCAAFTCA